MLSVNIGKGEVMFATKLLTIGHSNHSLDKFVRLLENNGVMTLVDVRTTPYSRYTPEFNKENLESALARRGIRYVHAGKYLGGRPSDQDCYKSRQLPTDDADYLHEVDYTEIMIRPWFVQAVNRLLELAEEQTTAIMCSEENPAECHRHHLIARYLIDEHPELVVQHIRGDGTVFSARSIRMSVDKPSSEQLPLL